MKRNPKRPVSSERQTWLRTAIYSFMTLTVTVIVSLLMLVVLGYQFNQKDGKLEQGGLLQFVSQPSGATVTLDGQRLLATTSTKSTVDAGVHYVTFDKDGYRQWQKTVTVAPGQVGWLNYARLIPSDIKPEMVRRFTTVAHALASQSRNYMLLQEAADKPQFTVADIRGDRLKYASLQIPEGVYTVPGEGKTQSFVPVKWSLNDDYILVKHTYNDDESEWIMIRRDDVTKSINITSMFAVNPSAVEFASYNGKSLFVQINDVVRRMNLDEQTLSRPLATKVANFTVYNEKTIAYASTADETGKRHTGYAAIDIPSPVKLDTYDDDGRFLSVGIAEYFGKMIASTIYGTDLTVRSGANLPTPANSANTMKIIGSRVVPAGVSKLEMSSSGRLTYITLPDGYGVFDLEFNKFDQTTLVNAGESKPDIHFLDDYTMWSDTGGQLWFYDFDGANRQNIMPVVEGLSSSLSPNGKYVYAFAPTDGGILLQRARLILP